MSWQNELFSETPEESPVPSTISDEQLVQAMAKHEENVKSEEQQQVLNTLCPPPNGEEGYHRYQVVFIMDAPTFGEAVEEAVVSLRDGCSDLFVYGYQTNDELKHPDELSSQYAPQINPERCTVSAHTYTNVSRESGWSADVFDWDEELFEDVDCDDDTID